MSHPLPLILLLLTLTYSVSAQVSLKCQNGGIASVGHCLCPQNFIGMTCDTPAHKLSSQQSKIMARDQYSYFYFQPEEINFYRLNFTICMERNPSLVPTIFFVTIQRSDGSLTSVPAFFQTFKLLLTNGGCTNFSSHYISIKRREDDSFRRIIVGLKTYTSKDKAYYFNTYSGKGMTNEQELEMANRTLEKPFAQSLTVKMTHQHYLQTSYQSTFVILLTSLVLMLVFGLMLNYIRVKYIEEQHQTINVNYSVRQIFEQTRRQNPQIDYQDSRNNDITVLDVFMPVTEYGTECKYFQPGCLESTTELPHEYPDNEACSICLVEFEEEDRVRTTPCKHRYHKECIDNWCEANLSCPICRRALDFSKEMRMIYLRYMRGELRF